MGLRSISIKSTTPAANATVPRLVLESGHLSGQGISGASQLKLTRRVSTRVHFVIIRSRLV